MIPLDIIQRIWQMLEEPSPSDEKQVDARELDMIDTPAGHPLLTIDTYQRRHLLIPIHQHRIAEDTQSAGIHLLVNQWIDDGKQHHYLDVVCLKPHLNDVFDLVIFDILVDLPKNEDYPEKVCYKALNQWRELFNREVSELPDTSTLLGIIGELWVLCQLAQYNPQAVNAWVGPSGRRYDFFTGRTALEVKSSSQRKGIRITIHGHDQMEPPADGELYLAVLKLEEAPGNGDTLSDMIQTLTDIGCDRYKILLSLLNLNLTPDIISRCDDRCFCVLEQRVYRVEPDFPCITTASFKGDILPSRIISVNYQIELSTEPPYPLQDDEVAALYQQIANEISE